MRLYTASNEEPLRARKLLADWAGEGFLTQTQYQRLSRKRSLSSHHQHYTEADPVPLYPGRRERRRRNRPTLLPLCLRLLGVEEKKTASAAEPSAEKVHSLWNCPVCGGTMRVVERLSAAQLLLRSPPQLDRCAA